MSHVPPERGMDATGGPGADATLLLATITPALLAPLQECAERLDGFVASSEVRFLEFSSALQRAISASQQVAGQSSRLLAVLNSDDLAALQDVLQEQSAGVLRQTDDGRQLVAEMSQRLEHTVATLRSIPAFGGSFHRTARSLRALGIASLIESARLGGDGVEFSGLANEVRDLAEQIAEKFAGVVERSGLLEKNLAESLESAVAAQGAQLTSAERMVGELDRGFKDLLAVRDATCVASKGLAARGETLSRDISSILGLMQEHDITRQRVEHVRDSLSRLVSELEGGADVQSASACPAALVSAVLELQTAQLVNSSDGYRTAMEDVRSRIRGLERETEGVSATVRELSAAEGERQVPVLEGLRQRLVVVAEGGRTASSSNSRLADVLASSARTAGEITGFVEDIDFIGSELELIAVNAIVKSSHTGVGGKPLAVIAQDIQRQSAEARKMTGKVSCLLREIGDNASALEQLARRFSEDTGRQGDGLQHDLLAALEGVERSDASAATCAEALASSLGEFGQALAAARRVGTLDGVLGQLAAEVGGQLAEVLRSVEGLPGADAQTLPEDLLAELSASYTMNSQRLIHQAVTAVETDAENPEPDHGDGLGDNVELF